jgi:hypothetical protein
VGLDVLVAWFDLEADDGVAQGDGDADDLAVAPRSDGGRGPEQGGGVGGRGGADLDDDGQAAPAGDGRGPEAGVGDRRPHPARSLLQHVHVGELDLGPVGREGDDRGREALDRRLVGQRDVRDERPRQLAGQWIPEHPVAQVLQAGQVAGHGQVGDGVVGQEGGHRTQGEGERPRRSRGGRPNHGEGLVHAVLPHVDRRDERQVGWDAAQGGIAERGPQRVDRRGVGRGQDEGDSEAAPGHA